MTGTPRRARWRVRALSLPAALVAVVALAAPANAAADTTPPTAPGPIQIADITETTIRLTWAASTDDVGVVSYEVNQSFTDVVLRRTTPTNEISVNGLVRSRSYGFSVSALDAAGNRSPSVFLRVVMPPGDSQPPTTPGTPVATAVTDSAVTLSWAPSVDNVLLVQYLVTRRNPDGTTSTTSVWLQPPIGPTTSARITGLAPNTTYAFSVRARDEAGNESAESGRLTLTTPGSTPGPASCAVTYAITSEWSTGFQTTVTIRNTGPAAIEDWRLAWTFPSGQQIAHLWGARPVDLVGPDVEVRAEPWNARIVPGASVALGFVGTRGGANAAPSRFTLNGGVC